jgi:hypothetical protein
MAIYELYGSALDDINQARKLLEASLAIQFEARESDYQGGDYFQWGHARGEHFVLKRNLDLVDGDPAEMSYPTQKVLLYLNDTPRADELRARVLQASFVLLRHEDLP